MFCRSAVHFSDHAKERMRERNVSETDVRMILRMGRKKRQRRNGEERLKVQVRESQLRGTTDRRLLNLVGLIVVVTRDERRVITVIRDEEPRYSPSEIRYLEDPGPSFKLEDAIGEQSDDDSNNSTGSKEDDS